jgi:hypothetical protein
MCQLNLLVDRLNVGFVCTCQAVERRPAQVPALEYAKRASRQPNPLRRPRTVKNAGTRQGNIYYRGILTLLKHHHHQPRNPAFCPFIVVPHLTTSIFGFTTAEELGTH